jgi:hypothetical protein
MVVVQELGLMQVPLTGGWMLVELQLLLLHLHLLMMLLLMLLQVQELLIAQELYVEI